MSSPIDVAARRAAIETQGAKLFSAGPLSQKIEQARTLASLPGMDLYATVVPWRISYGRESVAGTSETLGFAARDILSQLMALKTTLSPNATLTLSIDESRLPAPRQKQAPETGD
ncbi:MAG: hypothetical protein PHE27_02895 [Alphaproteobacteria bacterium]|nr:hypothetical protein [Alphaproteobacteria bacterium]